jgi:hypothetical protein
MVLAEATALVERHGYPYVMIGGQATAALLRPTEPLMLGDIDMLLRSSDADAALRLFADAGFSIEKRDPSWLYKAAQPDVTVDLIFRASGDVELDEEMIRRASRRQLKGLELWVPPPEDLLVMKACANSEEAHEHWFDALRLLSRFDIDWEYLLVRGRAHWPQRVASLMLYAMSAGIAVPDKVVEELFRAGMRPELHSEAASAAITG